MNFFQKLLKFYQGTAPAAVPRNRSAADWRDDFPPTFGPKPSSHAEHDALIFDPSMKQYARAFRRGDPVLEPEQMRAWIDARRATMRHLLDVISDTEWAGQLVLRGSLSLKAALGDDAREPGDIDWVVRPAELQMNEREAQRMLNEIVKTVAANATTGAVKIDGDEILRGDIWTYDRAPGHRIGFPWSCGSLPAAMITMDFVFAQKLHVPPVMIELKLDAQPALPVLAASNEESLAWKLLWLYSDAYPQGKDLYDAVLLAERTPLRGALLKTVFEEGGRGDPSWIEQSFLFPLRPHTDEVVDWKNFLKECPWVEGTDRSWMTRLEIATAPTVKEMLELIRTAS